MSSDFLDLVPVRQARDELPGHPSYSTLMRWIKIGVKEVRLRTVVVGGRRYVSRANIDEFIAQTTAAADGKPMPVRTARQRESDILAAERDLAKAK